MQSRRAGNGGELLQSLTYSSKGKVGSRMQRRYGSWSPPAVTHMGMSWENRYPQLTALLPTLSPAGDPHSLSPTKSRAAGHLGCTEQSH